jgi:hypothetical protein
MLTRRLPGLIGIAAAATLAASAQQVMLNIPGAPLLPMEDRVAVGDFDADGVPDVVVADDPQFNLSTCRWRGYSGVDGTLRFDRTVLGLDITAIGDVDADGATDFMTSVQFPPSFGPFYVYSGASGTQLAAYGWQSGPRASVGDADGDGDPDFVVARPGRGFWNGLIPTFDPGVATVADPLTAAVVAVVNGVPGDTYPIDAEPLGEVGGGPTPEIALIGHGNAYPPVITFPGFPVYTPPFLLPSRVEIVESGTGSSIRTHTYASGLEIRVAGRGDLDHDGLDDYAIAFGSTTTASIEFVAAASGSILVSVAVAGLPKGIAFVGDVDGDGVEDLVAARALAADIYSGFDGSLLATHPVDMGGTFEAPLPFGDLNGDGAKEFVAPSTPSTPSTGDQQLFVISPVDLPPAMGTLNSACGGAPGLLLAAGLPRLGMTWTPTLANGPAFAPAILVASDVPAAPIVVFGGPSLTTPCQIYLDLPTMFVLATPLLSATGTATLPFALPNLPALAGSSFALKAACLLPGGGIKFSNGRVGTLGY